jgi:hypothetical protein
MMDYLQIGNTKVEYKLVTSCRKRTIELVIDFNKGFTVKAPEGMKKEEIIKNLHRKESWIINNLDKMSDILKNESNKEFVSGEKFLLRGRRYPLKVSKSKKQLPALEFKKLKFWAIVPHHITENKYPSLIRPLFIQFYKQRAEVIIEERLKYQKYFKEKPKKIVITELKNKWGSCSQKNQIRYNWRIALAKTSIIDYVVVHELCHMVHKNHSNHYWDEVKRIIPDYEKSKKWLRENSEMLQV